MERSEWQVAYLKYWDGVTLEEVRDESSEPQNAENGWKQAQADDRLLLKEDR